jgi:hypothetical protein
MNDDLANENSKCTDGLPEPQNTQQIVSALHDRGRIYINELSSIKMRYKGIALQLLSSLFLALGWIALRPEENPDVNRLYLITFITLLAWLAIKLPAYLDVFVYHHQMSVIFKSMMDYEKRNPFLAQTYNDLSTDISHGKRKDPILFDVFYYSGMGLSIAILGIVSVYLKLNVQHPTLSYVLSFGLTFALLLIEVITAFTSIKYGLSRVAKLTE